MRQHGFTLFELLVSLLILVLLLTIGVPSLSQQIKNTRTKTITQELLQSVQQARTLAVSRNQRVTLRHKGTWEDGWELFVDHNHNGILDESEITITEREPIQGVKIYANGPLQEYISFIGTGESRRTGKSDGGSLQMGSLRVCTEDRGDGYQLILSRSGRMRLETMPAKACTAFK